MVKVIEMHREQRITKSGKFFKVYKADGGNLTYSRFVSIEAAKCGINAILENRKYTPAEHAIVNPAAFK